MIVEKYLRCNQTSGGAIRKALKDLFWMPHIGDKRPSLERNSAFLHINGLDDRICVGLPLGEVFLKRPVGPSVTSEGVYVDFISWLDVVMFSR